MPHTSVKSRVILLDQAARAVFSAQNSATLAAYEAALLTLIRPAKRAQRGRPAAQHSYQLTYRGSGATEHFNSTAALAKRLHLTPVSIGVRISQGKGSFTRLLPCLATGEQDVVTITRLDYAPGKGRPPKAPPSQS